MAHDPYCLQRQTMAKHDLLRNYLPVWARVLSQAGHANLMYIDGFSFTGRYTSDEDGGPGGPGSPLIALKCFMGEQEPTARGLFLFVEEKRRFVEELERNIDEWPHKRERDRIQCRCGRFDEQVLTAITTLENRAAEANARNLRPGQRGAPWEKMIIPAFVFIDPYGPTGFPMELVRRILSLPRTEVFINLMWVRTAFNLKHPDLQEKGVFTRVFGTDEWRDLVHLEGENLARAYLDLYMRQLRAPGSGSARIVRHFEMCGSDGALAYWMVFGTNSSYGWEKMKKSMWSVDPGGGFTYRDTTAAGQGVLFEPTPDLRHLRRLLLDRFGGGPAVDIAAVEEFVLMDTPFMPKGHLKRKTLAPMEAEGLVTVQPADGVQRRRGTFPRGSILTFSSNRPLF